LTVLVFPLPIGLCFFRDLLRAFPPLLMLFRLFLFPFSSHFLSKCPSVHVIVRFLRHHIRSFTPPLGGIELFVFPFNIVHRTPFIPLSFLIHTSNAASSHFSRVSALSPPPLLCLGACVSFFFLGFSVHSNNSVFSPASIFPLFLFLLLIFSFIDHYVFPHSTLPFLLLSF